MRAQRNLVLGLLAGAVAAVTAAGLLSAGSIAEWWRLRRLDSPDAAVRMESARRLIGMGSLKAVRRLLEIPSIERPAFLCVDPNVRLIVELGPRSVPVLLEALESGEERARVRAALALRQLRPLEAAAPLVRALGDGSETVRRTARGALGSLDPAAGDVVPRIIRALSAADGKVREGAAEALGELGVGAREAVPSLVEALADGSAMVRIHAAWALGDIGPDAAAAPALIIALRDPVDNVRRAAARAFTAMSQEDAATAIPALEAALEDEYSGVRDYAREALERLRGSPADRR